MNDFHPSTWKVYVHGFTSFRDDIDVDIGKLLWNVICDNFKLSSNHGWWHKTTIWLHKIFLNDNSVRGINVQLQPLRTWRLVKK
jgi:hypothetical protein